MKKLLAILSILILTGCSPKVSYILEEAVDTVEVYNLYEVKGCTLIVDDVEYEMTIKENNVNTNEIGTYTVDYSYDLDGNTYNFQRVVFVTDQTSPLLELVEGIDTIFMYQSWIDEGIIVTDNYSTEFEITIEGTVDTTTIGTYTIVYTVTDESLNESSITRVVTVVE